MIWVLCSHNSWSFIDAGILIFCINLPTVMRLLATFPAALLSHIMLC